MEEYNLWIDMEFNKVWEAIRELDRKDQIAWDEMKKELEVLKEQIKKLNNHFFVDKKK